MASTSHPKEARASLDTSVNARCKEHEVQGSPRGEPDSTSELEGSGPLIGTLRSGEMMGKIDGQTLGREPESSPVGHAVCALGQSEGGRSEGTDETGEMFRVVCWLRTGHFKLVGRVWFRREQAASCSAVPHPLPSLPKTASSPVLPHEGLFPSSSSWRQQGQGSRQLQLQPSSEGKREISSPPLMATPAFPETDLCGHLKLHDRLQAPSRNRPCSDCPSPPFTAPANGP